MATVLIAFPSLTESTLRSYGSQNKLQHEDDLSREKREDIEKNIASLTSGTYEYHDMDLMNDTDVPYHHNYLEETEQTRTAPSWHVEGPMPTISDSLFSLIILIYVSVIFVFMFFSFCWKEPDPPPPDPAHKNIPMITSMLEEMEKQELENKRAVEEAEAEKAAKEQLSLGGESTEMVEMKPVSTCIDKNGSAGAANGEGNGSVRKDADTIVVNVITEKSKSSTTPSAKEEQVWLP